LVVKVELSLHSLTLQAYGVEGEAFTADQHLILFPVNDWQSVGRPLKSLQTEVFSIHLYVASFEIVQPILNPEQSLSEVGVGALAQVLAVHLGASFTYVHFFPSVFNIVLQ
jgi:hypothetical protein